MQSKVTEKCIVYNLIKVEKITIQVKCIAFDYQRIFRNYWMFEKDKTNYLKVAFDTQK